MKIQINKILSNLFEIEIIKTFPRESTKFAKEYFKGREIIVIEIGTLEGKNARSILKNLNIGRIYLIDPYTKYKEHDQNFYDLESIEKKAHKFLGGYSDKITWVKEFSENAAKEIKKTADFIYIDGNHQYDFVKKDIQLYWKLLNDGGIIAGHDIQTEGVSKAVLEFATKNHFKLNFGDRRDWWIIKE